MSKLKKRKRIHLKQLYWGERNRVNRVISEIAIVWARLFIKCSPSGSNLIRLQLKQILSDRSRADWLFRLTDSSAFRHKNKLYNNELIKQIYQLKGTVFSYISSISSFLLSFATRDFHRRWGPTWEQMQNFFWRFYSARDYRELMIRKQKCGETRGNVNTLIRSRTSTS